MRSNTSITIIAPSVCNSNRRYARFHLVNWLHYPSRFSKPAIAKIRNSKPTAKVRACQCRQDVHPERDLAVAYIFWTDEAQSEFEARKYAHAQQVAMRSLEMHPGQEKALQVLAQAQFAQADFAGAAGSYRKLLELESTNRDVA